MRALRLTTAVVAALLSSACLVVSLQPVYEPETIAFDPGAARPWIAGDDGHDGLVRTGEWHSYHVTIAERDDRTRLSARLTRVGDQLYLDVSPLDGADVAPLLLPVHGIYRVELRRRRAVAGGSELRAAGTAGEGRNGRSADGDRRAEKRRDHRQHGGAARWLVAHAGDEGLFAVADDLAAQGRRPTPLRRADVLTHQLAAQDLADHRLGQFGAELDRRRHLVGREFLLAQPLQLLVGGADCPARRTTQAFTASPLAASGTPATPTSAIAGWLASTSSTSRGHT